MNNLSHPVDTVPTILSSFVNGALGTLTEVLTGYLFHRPLTRYYKTPSSQKAADAYVSIQDRASDPLEPFQLTPVQSPIISDHHISSDSTGSDNSDLNKILTKAVFKRNTSERKMEDVPSLESVCTIHPSRLFKQGKQLKNLDQLISAYKERWIKLAEKNPKGQILINKCTEAGRKICDLYGEKSLETEFGVQHILANKQGQIFVRHIWEIKFIGKGRCKKIFAVRDRILGQEHAWVELRGKKDLDRFESPTMKLFKQFLRNHPHLAFNPVHEFVTYQDKNEAIGMSIDFLYQGSAKQLRDRRKQPVFNRADILSLTESLKVFHQYGFIHQDIKNGNILKGEAKTACFTDYDTLCTTTHPRALSGTPGFVSHERTIAKLLKQPLSGAELQAGDIFALATTFYYDLEPKFKNRDLDKNRLDGYLKEYDPSSHDGPPLKEPKQVLYDWLAKEKALYNQNLSRIKGKLYPEYRELLWQAMSPNAIERPDAATFHKKLKALDEKGLLPV